MNAWWLAAAVLQTAALAVAGWFMWTRRGNGGKLVLAFILTGVGALILAANVTWLMTGGPAEGSWIYMRGGWFGFWLSNLTAGEILALGLLARVSRERWNDGAQRDGSASLA